MAWQAVTFSCGCDGSVQVYGPTRDRQRKADWIADRRECEGCYTDRIIKERAEQLASAKAQAADWELPELVGSEKQVAWAMGIRDKFVNVIKTFSALAEKKGIENHIELCGEPAQSILAETEARFWIDNSAKISTAVLDRELVSILKGRQDLLRRNVESPTTVLRPERDPISVVTLSIAADEISIQTVRKEAESFIEFLKTLGVRWSPPSWTIKVGPASVPVEHVAAAVTADILAKGYSVSTRHAVVIDLVRNDAFERPNPRKVSASIDRKHFQITTERGRPDDLWIKLKALPGAKWEAPSLKVPAKAAGEVADLAERLGFYVSPGAREIIEAHETIVVGKSQVAVVALASTKIQSTPVRGGIHADLRDE